MEQPFRFSTKYYDGGTGLVDFGYRFYVAEIGRWLSLDPLGIGGGINLYSYVGSNPINNVDFLGLSPSLGSCLAKCAADQFGATTLLGTAGVVTGLPIKTRRKPMGATQGTSIASKYLSEKFSKKLGSRVLAPTLKHPFAKSAVVGRIAGRWVPIVGWGLLAYDIGSIGFCVSKCLQEENNCRQ